MAIDLSKCVGCGACALACKTENNTEYRKPGESPFSSFNWCDYHVSTNGTFPNIDYQVLPVQCNHCSNAPCITGCLAPEDINGNKALYKTANGITMRDENRCIGCMACLTSCPYSTDDISTSNAQFSVNSFNDWGVTPQAFWADETSVVSGITSTPKEISTLATSTPPYAHVYTHPYYNAIRVEGVAEKCSFCDHRLLNGETTTFCQSSCPTKARVFGDLDDPNSEISLLLASSNYKRLKNNLGEFLETGNSGTEPNVYYLNNYSIVTDLPKVVENKISTIKVYPNPAKDLTTLEFNLKDSNNVNISIFDITGKETLKVATSKSYSQGTNNVKLDVSSLSPGTYICVIKTNSETLSSNIIITK